MSSLFVLVVCSNYVFFHCFRDIGPGVLLPGRRGKTAD